MIVQLEKDKIEKQCHMVYKTYSRISPFFVLMSDRKLWVILTKDGTVKGISNDLLSRASRYPVSNSIRVVELGLKLNVPSRILLETRIIISHEEQPLTCYGCNEAGHQYECPHKKNIEFPQDH